MAQKTKESQKQMVETETAQNNVIYANDVVTTIASLAVNEVEGIAGMCSVGGGFLGKSRTANKGVKVEIGTEEASVDIYVVVEYGTPIQTACQNVQENVRKAIESMTGLHVVRVDVHVQNVSFEKENNALQAGQTDPVLESGTVEETTDKPSEVTDEENPAAEVGTEKASEA